MWHYCLAKNGEAYLVLITCLPIIWGVSKWEWVSEIEHVRIRFVSHTHINRLSGFLSWHAKHLESELQPNFCSAIIRVVVCVCGAPGDTPPLVCDERHLLWSRRLEWKLQLYSSSDLSKYLSRALVSSRGSERPGFWELPLESGVKTPHRAQCVTLNGILKP